MKKLLTAAALSIFLASCGTMGGGDVMLPIEKADIAAHNLHTGAGIALDVAHNSGYVTPAEFAVLKAKYKSAYTTLKQADADIDAGNLVLGQSELDAANAMSNDVKSGSQKKVQ